MEDRQAPIRQSAFAKFRAEARADGLAAGTYELCGPRINGNPEHFQRHTLVAHEDAKVFEDVPCDFDGLRDWLRLRPYEGIVWHNADGRMAKLKRCEFPAKADDTK